jgi:Zn-dependent peptidase ImmA (M78 family)/DNA-binding XRE family transcriptional regulator
MRTTGKNKSAALPTIGDRIRDQRQTVRMKAAELAKLLGINRNTVSNYETGKTEPTASELVRVANALGCSIMDLLLQKGQPEAPRFAFRAHKALKKNSQIALAARKYLRAYREIEEITGTKLTIALRERPFEPDLVPKEEWIETAANEARQSSGIGTARPEAIAGTLEKLGVRCLFFRHEAKGLDALSVKQGEMALIMLHDRKDLIERTIFSAAHELGHLVLHPELFTLNDEKERNGRDYESEADLFAGCFLVPKDDLIRIWKEEPLPQLPFEYALVLLKPVFKVSFWCLYERVLQIGLATMERPELVTRVKKHLQIYRKAKMEELEPEPLDPGLLQKSTRFDRLIQSAFIQEKIGVAKVAEMLQITVEDAKEKTAGWIELK